MAVSKQFTAYLEQRLSEAVNQDLKLKHVSSVSGGSINAAYCLHTTAGDYMMKRNSKSAYPNMFACESAGLATIRKTHTIALPQTILLGEFEEDSFLVLEWIEAVKTTPATSKLLGQQLAAMHRHTAKQFGFDTDNYMGSLPQSNCKHDRWAAFFINERLQPMVKIGLNKGVLDVKDEQAFALLYKNLPSLFEEETPALIHGDLWSGNYLIGANQKPYLIDPAVTYGHREFDIAMTTLFGGYNREFYEAYQSSFPLAPGWQQRIDLWNLYPLLLHMNLFGGGYLAQVRKCLEKYI
jgi:protein-ribulosamine 3-kinase